MLDLSGAVVSSITNVSGRNFAFSIQIRPPVGRTLYFAADSLQEAADWQAAAQAATGKGQKSLPNSVLAHHLFNNSTS